MSLVHYNGCRTMDDVNYSENRKTIDSKLKKKKPHMQIIINFKVFFSNTK